MGLFNRNRNNVQEVKKPEVKPEPAKAEGINIREVLNGDEINLLTADLKSVGMRYPDAAKIAEALTVMIYRQGVIPAAALDLCILSVQETVGSMQSTFGFVTGGQPALLEKLTALKEAKVPA